jgi:hypothetical protein
MSIELEIEGVPDRAIAAAIRKTVVAVGREIEPRDQRRVTISPSETRGEWDLGIQQPSGWQLISFMAPVERLPDIVGRTLRERLVSAISS